MRKTRKDDVPTYPEMLEWYFNQQRFSPLSTPAQAVMTHLLHIMNKNYNTSAQITYKQLAARVNADVRTVKAKIQELCNKNYIDYTEINGEVCVAQAKVMQNSAQCVGVTPISASKESKESKVKKVFSINNLNEGENSVESQSQLDARERLNRLRAKQFAKLNGRVR